VTASSVTSLSDLIMANGERGADIKAVAILFLTLSWISVSLRCYVRLFIKKIFRVDDWLAVATLV
jgi:hypothetical protein